MGIYLNSPKSLSYVISQKNRVGIIWVKFNSDVSLSEVDYKNLVFSLERTIYSVSSGLRSRV